MTVGVLLVAYALAVGTVGTLGLQRSTWTLRAPRLGAVALLAAAWSVPLALVLAGVTVALPASAVTLDLGRLVGACVVRLRAAYGTPAGTGIVTVGQLLTVVVLARLGWTSARMAYRRRIARQRHHLLVRLAGCRRTDLPAVVLESPGPAAYSLAGRRATVVVTSGALDLLSAKEIDAVLAHEDAHLGGRHHRLLAAAALVADAFPMVPLVRQTPARVGRLLEMDADERAARHHEPRVLASALVAIASAAVTPSAPSTVRARMPREAHAPRTGGGAEAAARVGRLLRPPDRLTASGRLITSAGMVAVTTAPIVLAVAPALAAYR